MLAIKKARKLIESDPQSNASAILAELILALENDTVHPIGRLYDLDNGHFELSLEILREWRIDRYYASKSKLVNAALARQMDEARAKIEV